MKLTISLSKRIFYIEEPLIVNTRLENLSKRDLTVHSIGGIATNALSYKIEQLFEDGKNYEVVIVNSENELDYFRSAACRSISNIQRSHKK